jgi:calcineurin-like phosphoesterase family protein
MSCRRAVSSSWACLLLLVALLCAYCAAIDPQSPTSPDGPPLPPRPDEVTTLVGAGDVGVCDSDAPLATGRLLDHLSGTIFAAGDLAYQEGTAEQFLKCYEAAWGRHKSRTRPAPGNHEYYSPGAAPYFAYFGSSAGPPGLGYYRYASGNWQIYSLNSSIAGTQASAELQWLRSEMASQPSVCSLAYFHHPRFSSGPHGQMAPVPVVRDLWFELYNSGVDITIAGHEHFYERFAPQTADGVADPDYGIRQFVVGTGGAPLAPALRRVPNSEVVLTSHGILKLTLEPQSYKWEFLSAEGGAVLDSGIGACHLRR